MDHAIASFLGKTVLRINHGQKGTPVDEHNLAICSVRKRCRACLKTEVGLHAVKKHKCGYMHPKSCDKYVEMQSHSCFIKKAPTPKEEREIKKRK